MTGTNLTTLPEILVVEREGEPRARDIDIAERLGLARPRNIRKLIENNRAELEAFGPIPLLREAKAGKGRPEEVYLLNEEQSLLVATLSSAPNAPAVRAMLIRTFVAWRRGHLDAPAFDMRAVGGMVKGILARQLAEVIPSMIVAELSTRTMMIRRGKTAGQIWKEHGFPPIRLGGWFSNRLRAMKCEIEGGGCGELGLSTARLYDPDKADAWLRNGGRMMVERKIAERKGQGALRLVGGHATA
ncbi:hypothetical protein MEX01_47800 [Methylorubrum extorquens]|uniref:hypothetical protein n=1 Tax=Methylorubrum extorquens TaxID=408 RepID=UPI0011710C62|nr:hypothetical protein [Methylorubrum extorquens]GEL44189.1 hypothetical protein MEX01_47800 [Methylorubrum extorquens]